MGVELSILGIRKIKDEEIKELTGKTRIEMEKCRFFRNFFPHAPYNSSYWTYSHKEILMDDSYKSVIHMFSPVKDAAGDIDPTGYNRSASTGWLGRDVPSARANVPEGVPGSDCA